MILTRARRCWHCPSTHRARPCGGHREWNDLPFHIAQAHDDLDGLKKLKDVPGIEHVYVDTPGGSIWRPMTAAPIR